MEPPRPPLTLRSQPDWSGAAEVLIEGCAHLPTQDERVRWLERVCLSLGDSLYPAFLRVLCLIGEQGDANAQRVVAETLVHALESGRLPSGRHAAWGATSLNAAGFRAMDPIEYLCAWHAQPDGRGALNATAFDRNARALLGLVSHSDLARRLYCAKIRADAEDPLDGSWARNIRQALRAMADCWEKTGGQRALRQRLQMRFSLRFGATMAKAVACRSWSANGIRCVERRCRRRGGLGCCGRRAIQHADAAFADTQ